MSCSLRPVGHAHRARFEALVRGTGLFHEAEVATALELLDDALDGDDDYRFLGAFDGDDLTGYACFGPTPDTLGTYDLYWIAVDRARQGEGIGTQLVEAVEQTVSAGGGRLIVVETSSRVDYNPTRAFYEAKGFDRTATIPGYYAPGDDLVIYVKDLTHGHDLAGAAS
ncbi:MAG: GNAT family N-acetyltransferase [Gemmatimonadales bacterium]